MGRYAQSWLFYGWGKNVSRETFSIVIFAFASVFCIGSSIRGVDNTTKPPVFCSTNRFFWILLCSILFCSALRFFCYPSPVPPCTRLEKRRASDSSLPVQLCWTSVHHALHKLRHSSPQVGILAKVAGSFLTHKAVTSAL